MEHKIYSINGPVVKTKSSDGLFMLERVLVGPQKLIGEVISISGEGTVIQVYESTTGLKKDDLIYGTGELVSATLGPGLLNNIFDGIERPLLKMAAESGAYIQPGSDMNSLPMDKHWDITICVKPGEYLHSGMIFATTPETKVIEHRFLVPNGLEGEVVLVKENGQYLLSDSVVTIKTKEKELVELPLLQKWPIKKARPILERLPLKDLLITGQRVIDTLFPLAKGGTACVPGGFGAGKTMMQHQLAKWCDADIIVYIGCGERGNEMTQVLEEFGDLIDPKSQAALMERTVLIANTSNMPVAAREASIYTGLTIAEYYRDMGYHIAIMADSTSRWAEALREISGRLEEMPAEEGFPAYLPSRISQFYERAGVVKALSEKEGSVSIIGAVSPQGSDFSEPVTQNTKRFVRCFWALDKELAYQRHYAAVNWNLSYSEYIPELESWFHKIDPKFLMYRKRIVSLLAEEHKLIEIVNLIGSDVLPDSQKIVIEIGRVIRLGFLQQNAFHKDDTFVSIEKQSKMMELILYLYDQSLKFMKRDRSFSLLLKTNLFDQIIKMKYQIKEGEFHLFEEYKQLIDKTMEEIL